MKFHSGNIRKMRTTLGSPPLPIIYKLPIGDELVEMNAFLGQEISLRFNGLINCKQCKRKTNKSFSQGFCYKCFSEAPENSPCILRPELCEGHLGKGRDVEWEQRAHVQPHIVYLALSSAVKVGVTRAQQVPTRWIDQGATQAIILAETPYRQLAGLIEVALKGHFTDKTNWRKMLKNEIAEDVDLLEVKEEALQIIADEMEETFQDLFSDDDEVTDLIYPALAFPTKLTSLSFDKTPTIEGTLMGIKGQYLLLSDNRVLNMRKHEGYFIELEVKEATKDLFSIS